MILSRAVFLLILSSLVTNWSWAQVSEETRLRGFAEQRKNATQFEEARQRGERAYLEEEEQWENQKNRDLDEYKKSKKKIEMNEDGPEAKADAAAKKALAKTYEEDKQAYNAEKSKQEKLARESLNLPSEAQELGLDENRPRYDYRKRASFGAQQKFGKSASTGGGSSSSSGGSSSYGGGSSSPGNFPPPPTFDDFGDGGGYVPAPMPEDFGDVPPPPPPPPPPYDDFGGFGGGVDFPPPPPPPPPFGGDGDF